MTNQTPAEQQPATEPDERTKSVSISIELDIDDLTLDDCYPDGVPAGCTPAQLLATILESGSLTAFLDDWDLDDGVFARVSVSVAGVDGYANGQFR